MAETDKSELHATPSVYADLPALSWSDPTGIRVFYCDAFISHRRGDASADLAKRLATAGVRTWHDHHADLSHRNVREHVRFALNSSRTIIVCVGADGSLSDWCRAEYQPGLYATEKENFERVVVVKLHDDAVVPEDLRECHSFSANSVDQIAKYLLDANHPSRVDDAKVRPWIQSRFALGDLPFSEIAVLGKKQLALLRESESDDPLPWEDYARRLISGDLRVASSGWLDDNPDIPSTAVEPLWELYRYLGNALLERTDVLVRLTPFEIVDFVLAPLGWLQTKFDYPEEVRSLFAHLCLAVAENSDHAGWGAAWLSLSDAIARHASLAGARLEMQEAVDDYQMLEGNLKSAAVYGSDDVRDQARQELEKLSQKSLARCRAAVAQSILTPAWLKS